MAVRRAAWMAGAALLAAFRPALAQFEDPLDRPAERSRLASRRLLLGVAAAGGRLVAVGQRGHIVWSDDAGASWTQASVPVSTDLTAIRMVSPERGWAVGHGGVVLATADGGTTWTRQLDGRRLGALLATAYTGRARDARPGLREQLETLGAEGADLSFLDVHFDDERTGFAVGAFNLVVRTDDGGATWTPWLDRSENPRGLHLYAIRRAAGALWVVGEQGIVLRLDPGARLFRRVKVPPGGSLFGIVGHGRSAIAHGLRGRVLRSADGGASWREVRSGVEDALNGSAALPDGRIAIVTQAGQVLLSDDAGASFGPARGEPGAPAAAAAPARARGLAIVGAAGVRVEALR
ncbi:MAG TPA: YCF48-related protein [Anaeromyxobacter sp.]|nr:YCF48-related protein [Anaeromyxobacter sp.]